MQKQQQGKQLKHKKINFKSINWENLLLWSLLIVSFILAIVAISKSGKGVKGDKGEKGDEGEGVNDWFKNEDNVKNARNTLLSDVQQIIFSNGSLINGTDQALTFNVPQKSGMSIYIKGDNKQAQFSLNDERDIFSVGDLKQGGNYFYYNEENKFDHT